MHILIWVHLDEFLLNLKLKLLGVKEEIAEKLAANNLSTIKEGKNKVLESKTAIQSENLSKMTETMVHVPIIAATDSNFGDGIEKSM